MARPSFGRHRPLTGRKPPPRGSKSGRRSFPSPGALERASAPDPTLGAAIDRYIAEKGGMGRTKAQVLKAIKNYPIAEMACSAVGSPEIVAFAQSLPVQPQTVGNYLSHLGAVFAVARPAWGYALSQQAMKDARVVARRLDLATKARHRDRRPTLAELDLLLTHFTQRRANGRRQSDGQDCRLCHFLDPTARRDRPNYLG